MKQALPHPAQYGVAAPNAATSHRVPGRWLPWGAALLALATWYWPPTEGGVGGPPGAGTFSTPIASPEEQSPPVPESVRRYLSSLDATGHGNR